MRKLISIIFLNLLFMGNSGGPGQGYSHNAPNFNNCTNCHSGTVNSGDGNVTFTGLPESYVPGATYSIGVTVTVSITVCLPAICSIITHFHSVRSSRYLEEIFLPVSRTFLHSPQFGKTTRNRKIDDRQFATKNDS